MTTAVKTPTPAGLPAATLNRILDEGYGPGAWYGPDLQAAVADVNATDAFRRPAPGRHNIAEIALHHAFYVREVFKRLTGTEPKAFPLAGEDWFELADESRLSWNSIRETLGTAQQRLSEAAASIGAGKLESPLAESERFDLAIGLTGHAAYHAGQIQLVKKLL